MPTRHQKVLMWIETIQHFWKTRWVSQQPRRAEPRLPLCHPGRPPLGLLAEAPTSHKLPSIFENVAKYNGWINKRSWSTRGWADDQPTHTSALTLKVSQALTQISLQPAAASQYCAGPLLKTLPLPD